MAADDRRQRRIIISGLHRYTDREAVKLTLAIHRNLLDTTPVDTGWAKANWVPSVGEPFEVEVGREGDVGRAQSLQQRGQANVIAYKRGQGQIHVTNNVPYIQVLNAGHSQQAPAGFVESAVALAVAASQLDLTVDVE